jgi:hypothetical protein
LAFVVYLIDDEDVATDFAAVSSSGRKTKLVGFYFYFERVRGLGFDGGLGCCWAAL